MKKTIKNIGMAMGLLLLIGQFTSCDSKKSTKMNNETNVEQIADNNLEPTATYEAVYIRKPVVFLTGIDKKSENFYANARAYFKEKEYEIVEEQYSLEEIILWLNKNVSQIPFGEIHIVNNSNPFEGLDLETVINGKKLTATNLNKSISEGALPVLQDVIDTNSKIIFHATGVSENKTLINTLKDVFYTEYNPKIVAPAFNTIFGGEFSNHYLAAPFYVFYPTANSPGKVDLSKEIAKKYPEEKEIDWLNALNNYEERYVGEVYTTQYNVPVEWVFDYHNSDEEIPAFNNQKEAIEWIEQNEDLASELEKLKIPVQKFRWQWTINKSMLVLKGKTTVVCVLKPLIKPYGDLKHIEPDTNNKRLYAMK